MFAPLPGPYSPLMCRGSGFVHSISSHTSLYSLISLVIVWTTTGHLADTCSRSVYYLYDGINESSVNLVSTTIPRNPLITDRIFNLLSTAVSEA